MGLQEGELSAIDNFMRLNFSCTYCKTEGKEIYIDGKYIYSEANAELPIVSSLASGIRGQL